MIASVVELFPTRIGEARLPAQYELALRWLQERERLILSAIEAEKWAFSHRQIARRHPTRIARYGTAAMFYREGHDENRIGIEIGWNLKLKAGSWTEGIEKLCAERHAISQAIGLGYTGAYGLVTYSNNMQADDVSGEFCNIQQPCHECRLLLDHWLLPSSPLILVRQRLPCDVNPQAEYFGPYIVEDWTYGDICRLHRHRGYHG